MLFNTIYWMNTHNLYNWIVRSNVHLIDHYEKPDPNPVVNIEGVIGSIDGAEFVNRFHYGAHYSPDGINTAWIR